MNTYEHGKGSKLSSLSSGMPRGGPIPVGANPLGRVDVHEKLGFLADESSQQVEPRSGS